MSSTEKTAPTSTFGRSVVDFVSADELQKALDTMTPQGKAQTDWMLPMEDPTAEKQTREGELQRLLNLKSFMLLDAEKEEEFDKLTQEAREAFGVPTSLISLIDLGRQFFLSKTGADASETTRAASFCGYTIQNKEGILVVPDAKEDYRFKDGELVNKGPKTRFYAGAALVSPEGEKLGAFCLNGTEPRPEGLNEMEKGKLKEYAAKTMEIMVERRKRLRDRLSADNISKEMRYHSAVATSLGDIMYLEKDLFTAMRLYQESVQTIMSVEENPGAAAGLTIPKERQEAMVQLLTLLSHENVPDKMKQELMERVVALYEPQKDQVVHQSRIVDGVSGLFYLRHESNPPPDRDLPELVFCDVFKIDTRECIKLEDDRPLEQLDFTVPIEECSKATLFNMGQIQYHWQNQETAMQFFHLAASVSHKLSPLAFDPVDISCINNMAQIHLQYGQPEDAMKMLKEALERGNRTLAAMYRQTEVEHADENNEIPADFEERDVIRTRRLRRKLARTLINIAHVHFQKTEYDDAMATLRDAVPLLDEGMRGRTLAAVWYDMALILQQQGNREEAITYLDKYIRFVVKTYGADHIQIGDGLHQKAVILFELGKTEEALGTLEDSITIRTKILGGNSSYVLESLELKGKLLLGKSHYDEAIVCLQKALDGKPQDSPMDLPKAQIMLDLGRAQHAKKIMDAALKTYSVVLEWARTFFGADHPFVARIAGIVKTIQTESA
eukprot:CAMPEP_0172471272 /NCGR_PEP_ID=MMETSP1065-20121228/67733_1 /TAXON_ID=265537 /ORGANISM="Amphiprora paludosa, Strain CCMP125" /LENGTH=726 /DNA_ID=CAMNT_0013229367 /DNA_START=183 /DNA_END=2363 /DNA_ORIENTATION=-